MCLAWQHHSGGKKGVSKGKAERRGRGKKEKPTSETRDVHGTNHTQGNGRREAPEPLDIVLIPASFLTVPPFPEAVDLRDALGMVTFLPRNSLSLSGGAIGTPKNMLQGGEGMQSYLGRCTEAWRGGEVGWGSQDSGARHYEDGR